MFSGQQYKTPRADQAAGQVTSKPPAKPTGYFNSPAIWVTIYVLALTIRFWFNFDAPHMNAYGACDASEYLRNAIVLHSLKDLPASFWQDAFACLTGQANEATQHSVQTTLSYLNELKISSPVFPTFLIAGFLLTGTEFDTSNWMLMLGLQSFISAFTAVLIAHTAYLVWNRKVGYAAGILTAIYPGFIINSGRLYSETFAVFLMSLLVWLVVKDFMAANKETPQNKFGWVVSQLLKGFTAICLQLTRSIMVAMTAALVPITVLTYWHNKSKAKIITSIALMTIGYLAVAMPWIALQKVAFGTSTLLVDRVGHYNFFVGNNAETQGWLSVPYPDGRGIENRSLLTLWQAEVKKSPSAWMRLMQDKLPRLLKFPWNDFRTPIGLLGVCQQITIHQMILLLGVVGIALSLFGNVLQRSNRSQLFCRLMIFSIAAFQLVYCFFITVPRYNIGIMPFIIMFAAAGIISLWRMVKNGRSNKTAIAVVAIATALFSISRLDSASLLVPQLIVLLSKAIVLLALAVALWQASNYLDGNKKKTRILILALLALVFVPFAMPVRAHGRANEWQQTISNNSITQTIALSDQQLSRARQKNSYLLIDAESQTALANDVVVTVNGQQLSGPFIPSLSFANDLSHVVPISKGAVAFEQEYIFDCLTQDAATSNADLRQWYLLPIPKEALSSNTLIRVTAKEKPFTVFGTSSSEKNLIIPSLTRYSWEKSFYGVENTHGLTDTRYDQRVKLEKPTGKVPNVFVLADDTESPTDKLVTIVSATSDNNECALDLPEYDNEETWLIRLTGQARGENALAGTKLSITCRDNKKQTEYQSPWCQKSIATDTPWRNFDCAFPLKPSTLPGTALNLRAQFLPVSELSNHRNNHKQALPPAAVRNLKVEVMHLPAVPFTGNYQLYLGQGQK
ncbi:MAG: hypothetical protein K2Y22_05765 [Candidatus Obscuribacterales bacterium]|nr:hypothetical protein [Candidatus Obscuribacterales bacterium]